MTPAKPWYTRKALGALEKTVQEYEQAILDLEENNVSPRALFSRWRYYGSTCRICDACPEPDEPDVKAYCPVCPINECIDHASSNSQRMAKTYYAMCDALKLVRNGNLTDAPLKAVLLGALKDRLRALLWKADQNGVVLE